MSDGVTDGRRDGARWKKMNSSKTEREAPRDNEGDASAGQTLHSKLLFSD